MVRCSEAAIEGHAHRPPLRAALPLADRLRLTAGEIRQDRLAVVTLDHDSELLDRLDDLRRPGRVRSAHRATSRGTLGPGPNRG